MKFCAVFSLFHNEKRFLPIWLTYYGRNFGYENLYVLDHDTTDGSTDDIENLGVNHSIYHHKKINDNENFMTKTLQAKQEELLKIYEYVICPDADEFLLPDPDKYENLRDYVENMKENNVKIGTTTGYEVLHDRINELPIDWNKSLLPQRKTWIHLFSYNKPIILSEVMLWQDGKHRFVGLKPKNDKDLILCHLARIDYDLLNEKRNGSIWRIAKSDQNKFDTLFDDPHWNNRTGKLQKPETIPKKWYRYLL